MSAQTPLAVSDLSSIAAEVAGLTDPDIDGKALQAAFFGDPEGDALDRYEFAILNALCDDPRAIEGIFEDPLETIQHVRRLAQTSTFDDAERYRKWLKGLAAAHRRRPAVPVAAPEPAKESDRATETAHYHTIVPENVRNRGKLPGERRWIYAGAGRMRLARGGIFGPGMPRRAPMNS